MITGELADARIETGEPSLAPLSPASMSAEAGFHCEAVTLGGSFNPPPVIQHPKVFPDEAADSQFTRLLAKRRAPCDAR